MLELGKAGSAGTAKGVLPVLRDGAVVATLRAAGWKEAATAVIGGTEWVFAKRKGELTGRWAADPENAVRLRLRQASFWKGTWEADLEGAGVRVEKVSMWNGKHRYLADVREVGRSGSTGGWSPRPTLEADSSMPLHHQVFLLWLELLISRRNMAAVGGVTAIAVVGGSG